MVKIKNYCDIANEKHKRMAKERKAKKFAVGIAVIGAIGVTFGIMMATKKGMELHKIFKSRALDYVEKTKDTIQNRADAVHDTAENAAMVADDVFNNLDKKADDLHKNIKHGYHDVKNDISKTVKNISSDLKKADKWEQHIFSLLM